MTESDPRLPFKVNGANVDYGIAKLTLLTKRSVCAAVIGSLVRFLRRKLTWDGPPHLVAL